MREAGRLKRRSISTSLHDATTHNVLCHDTHSVLSFFPGSQFSTNVEVFYFLPLKLSVLPKEDFVGRTRLHVAEWRDYQPVMKLMKSSNMGEGSVEENLWTSEWQWNLEDQDKQRTDDAVSRIRHSRGD
jgi:hypothetical protein